MVAKELLKKIEGLVCETNELYLGCPDGFSKMTESIIAFFHNQEMSSVIISDMLLLFNLSNEPLLLQNTEEETEVDDTVFWFITVELLVSFLDSVAFSDVEGHRTLFLGGFCILDRRHYAYWRYATLFGDITAFTLSIGERIGEFNIPHDHRQEVVPCSFRFLAVEQRRRPKNGNE
jgi:hypothetical protein